MILGDYVLFVIQTRESDQTGIQDAEIRWPPQNIDLR